MTSFHLEGRASQPHLPTSCNKMRRIIQCLNKRSVDFWFRSKERLILCRSFTSEEREEMSGKLSGKGVVIGCYEADQGVELTDRGKQLNDKLGGKIQHLINVSGNKMKCGETRLFYDLSQDITHAVVVNIGKRDPSEVQEDIIMSRENVRIAAGVGAKLLQKAKVKQITMDDFSDPESCSVGTHLALFQYEDMKGKDKKSEKPSIELWSDTSSDIQRGWSNGSVIANAQNFARWLMETPSNHMTPSDFVDAVSTRLGNLESDVKSKLEIMPRPLSWIKEKQMGAFLAVTQGSDEEPWFLEVKYNGGPSEQKPLALVGKGITFDSGGISIKPSSGMGEMKADMGGAACVAASTIAIATMGLPLNVISLMPLCENMPSGKAIKPGDVVKAMNGKTIEIDNTDAEGRLILADALCHVHSYNPSAIIDMATLTGAIGVALGSGASGMYTTSQSIWERMHQAGRTTGDRVWRMPLYKQYRKQMDSHIADINNVGTRGRMAGSCTAASFLKEFVEITEWAHLDIAGVMQCQSEIPYMAKGMSGRPTRTIIEFARLLCSN